MATNNGNYKIVIAVTTGGTTLVGASDVNHYDKLSKISCREHVYGIQIGHRCAINTKDGWEIMTPTQAKKEGYTENDIRWFPGNPR